MPGRPKRRTKPGEQYPRCTACPPAKATAVAFGSALCDFHSRQRAAELADEYLQAEARVLVSLAVPALRAPLPDLTLEERSGLLQFLTVAHPTLGQTIEREQQAA